MNHYEEIASRDWQQAGLNNYAQFLKDPEKSTFLTVACPGAGKTRFSLAAMRMTLDSEQVDLFVVIAPTETLRRQWAEEAAAVGIKLEHYTSEDLMDAVSDGLDAEAHGVVTTYAQIDRVAEVFEHFCMSLRVMVIIDEVHHCAEHLAWGDRLSIAFNHAPVRLVLSGTPFRTDDGRMPFIMETTSEGQHVVREPDASYTYAEACDDHVCRVMYFPRVNANIRFEDDDGMWEHYLDDDSLEVKFRNRMYNAALDTARSDFSRYLLEQAYEKLLSLREKDQPNAAMLVIARDNAHAQALKDIMHGIMGEEPAVVNTDQQNSAKRIRRFRNGKKPVMIAVKMFSEGVDAPRIRVIAFLTRIKTEMWFRQIVGRGVRMQSEVPGDQPAFMFIPKIPTFEQMARRIEEEIAYVINQRDPPPQPTWTCESCGHVNPAGGNTCEECGAERPKGPPPPPPPTITVHGSTDESMAGFISMGVDNSEAVTEMARDLINTDPLLKRFQPEYTAMVVRAMSTNPTWAKRFDDVLNAKHEANEYDDDDDDTDV